MIIFLPPLPLFLTIWYHERNHISTNETKQFCIVFVKKSGIHIIVLIHYSSFIFIFPKTWMSFPALYDSNIQNYFSSFLLSSFVFFFSCFFSLIFSFNLYKISTVIWFAICPISHVTSKIFMILIFLISHCSFPHHLLLHQLLKYYIMVIIIFHKTWNLLDWLAKTDTKVC